MMSAAEREGAVLPVSVLVVLALLGLAHALLVAAEGAYRVSRAHAEVVALDGRASGAMERELARGWVVWMDSVGVGGQRVDTVSGPGPFRTAVTWRRLEREAWLVETAAAPVGRALSRSTSVGRRRLVWIYEAGARVSALPGVVSTGPGATVSGAGTVVADSVPALGVVGAPGLGLLPLPALLLAADTVGPAGTPEPIDLGGVCDTTPKWNWGDPLRPYRPCGPHRPLKGRGSTLLVDGGSGQGVLVVDGDLTLRGGAVHHGLIVASGEVRLAGGSTVEGRVVAFGGIVLEAGTRVVGSPDRARDALDGARGQLSGVVLLHRAASLGPG